MPVFDQGYQHWKGELSGHAWRWLTIARHGVRTQFRSRWPKMVFFAACVPALALATVLSLWGLVEQKSSIITPFLNLLRGLPEEILEGPGAYRVTVWTLTFEQFFRVQILLSMLLVVLIGPGLISQDLRFNAIPLYLSRPVRRFDYFIGKFGVIALALGSVAVAPTLLAYVLGICFSLDFGVLRDTARLLAGAVAYGVIVVVSAGTLMLAISSLSRNSRYVGAIWIGFWLLSGAVGTILSEEVRQPWCGLVSYTNNLKVLGDALLDTKPAHDQLNKLIASRPDPRAMGFGGPGRRGMRDGPMPPPRPMAPPQVREEVPPPSWYQSAGVLAGLFGLSAWTLSLRVKSLDRLK